ncbi:MAG: hypothetical protein JW810_03810 [Sedimentisphaerales bacterium]|nr:hypothetical protein [Sedimentisphaerales bacterium]
MLPAGLLANAQGIAALPGLLLVGWQSPLTDKRFQVYVDGTPAQVTEHARQRMMLVEYEHVHPAAIEVIWVDLEDQYRDVSGQLTGFSSADGAHAIMHLPRLSRWPRASRVHLYGDGGMGSIDYSRALQSRPLWPNPLDSWGFGLDAFGGGDFGYSGTGAVGWGKGGFGIGEMGFDADELVLATEALPAGVYQFAVQLTDEFGNLDGSPTEIFTIGIDPIPAEPALRIESYDDVNDELRLEIRS